jgi:cell division transport system permease protein
MIGFLGFSVRRALEGFWRNGVMSLAATVTMALMLLLLSGLLIVLSGLQSGVQFVEGKVEIEAYLGDGASSAQVEGVQARLESMPEVVAVRYVSKEEARREFREALRAQGRDDPSFVLESNPFPASLGIQLRDPGVYRDVVTVLEEAQRNGIVDEIQLTRQIVDALIAITGVLRALGLGVLGMVGLIVLFVVVNSIRLAVMARGDEIEIMRLVGASNAFIRWPFIFEGLLVGLLGAGITLAVLALASGPITALTNALVSYVPVGFDSGLQQQLIGVVLATGLALGGIGAGISVRAYLRA